MSAAYFMDWEPGSRDFKMEGSMKRFFLRAVAYAGLYAEIFSASCRWLNYGPRGWSLRASWKAFVTEALVASAYLPPTSAQVEEEKAKRAVLSQHDSLVWMAEQPETIQTCLKINSRAVAATLKSAHRIKERGWVPDECIKLGPEFWERFGSFFWECRGLAAEPALRNK